MMPPAVPKIQAVITPYKRDGARYWYTLGGVVITITARSRCACKCYLGMPSLRFPGYSPSNGLLPLECVYP